MPQQIDLNEGQCFIDQDDIVSVQTLKNLGHFVNGVQVENNGTIVYDITFNFNLWADVLCLYLSGFDTLNLEVSFFATAPSLDYFHQNEARAVIDAINTWSDKLADYQNNMDALSFDLDNLSSKVSLRNYLPNDVLRKISSKEITLDNYTSKREELYNFFGDKIRAVDESSFIERKDGSNPPFGRPPPGAAVPFLEGAKSAVISLIQNGVDPASVALQPPWFPPGTVSESARSGRYNDQQGDPSDAAGRWISASQRKLDASSLAYKEIYSSFYKVETPWYHPPVYTDCIRTHVKISVPINIKITDDEMSMLYSNWSPTFTLTGPGSRIFNAGTVRRENSEIIHDQSFSGVSQLGTSGTGDIIIDNLPAAEEGGIISRMMGTRSEVQLFYPLVNYLANNSKAVSRSHSVSAGAEQDHGGRWVRNSAELNIDSPGSTGVFPYDVKAYECRMLNSNKMTTRVLDESVVEGNWTGLSNEIINLNTSRFYRISYSPKLLDGAGSRKYSRTSLTSPAHSAFTTIDLEDSTVRIIPGEGGVSLELNNLPPSQNTEVEVIFERAIGRDENKKSIYNSFYSLLPRRLGPIPVVENLITGHTYIFNCKFTVDNASYPVVLQQAYTHRGIRDSMSRIKFNIVISPSEEGNKHTATIIEKIMPTIEEQFQKETISAGMQAQYEDESDNIKTNLGIISRYRLVRVNTDTGEEEEISPLVEAGIPNSDIDADAHANYTYRAELKAERAAALNTTTVAQGSDKLTNRDYEYHFQKYNGAYATINRILPADGGHGGVSSLVDAYTSIFTSTDVPATPRNQTPATCAFSEVAINVSLHANEYSFRLANYSREDVNFFIIWAYYSGVTQPAGIFFPGDLTNDGRGTFLDRKFYANPGNITYSLGAMLNDFSFIVIPQSPAGFNTADSNYYFLESGEVVPVNSITLSAGGN